MPEIVMMRACRKMMRAQMIAARVDMRKRCYDIDDVVITAAEASCRRFMNHARYVMLWHATLRAMMMKRQYSDTI